MKALLTVFSFFMFAFLGITSQMVDVWVFGSDSKIIDFIFGWISFIIFVFAIKSMDDLYKKL